MLIHFQKEQRSALQEKVRKIEVGLFGLYSSMHIILKALDVVIKLYGQFHLLYGDEIVGVLMPLLTSIYANCSIAMTRAVYKK